MGRQKPKKTKYKISPCQECIVRSMCEAVCEILWDYIEPHFIVYDLDQDDWRAILHFLRTSLQNSSKFEEWVSASDWTNPDAYSLFVTFDSGNITQILSTPYGEKEKMDEKRKTQNIKSNTDSRLLYQHDR